MEGLSDRVDQCVLEWPIGEVWAWELRLAGAGGVLFIELRDRMVWGAWAFGTHGFLVGQAGGLV